MEIMKVLEGKLTNDKGLGRQCSVGDYTQWPSIHISQYVKDPTYLFFGKTFFALLDNELNFHFRRGP